VLQQQDNAKQRSRMTDSLDRRQQKEQNERAANTCNKMSGLARPSTARGGEGGEERGIISDWGTSGMKVLIHRRVHAQVRSEASRSLQCLVWGDGNSKRPSRARSSWANEHK
jgi:hypothetical protein